MYICGYVTNLKVKVLLYILLYNFRDCFSFLFNFIFWVFKHLCFQSQINLTGYIQRRFTSSLPFSFLPHRWPFKFSLYYPSPCLFYPSYDKQIHKYSHVPFLFCTKHSTVYRLFCALLFLLNTVPWVCPTLAHSAPHHSCCEMPGQVSLSQGPWAVGQPGPWCWAWGCLGD